MLSCVGVQFCADHAAVAGELARVCRPGGRIALISWTPEGFIGQVLAAVARAAGGAGGGPSPLDWGREERVRELFAGRSTAVTCGRGHVDMPAASPHAWVDYMAGAYGPLVRARSALEAQGDWAPLRQTLGELAAAHDVGTGGAFAGRAAYLTASIAC